MALDIIHIPPQNQITATGSIVLLHGWGANAQNLVEIAEALSLDSYQFFLPNAPFPHPYNPVGRMWYDLVFENRFTSKSVVGDQQQLATSRHLLNTWLQELPKLSGVPLERTILAGFSQGGAMTLDVGPRLPLASLVVLSGYLHEAIPKADYKLQLPSSAFIVHGCRDNIVPIAAAHQTRSALEKAGFSVTYQELDMAHEVSWEALRLLRRYITSHKLV